MEIWEGIFKQLGGKSAFALLPIKRLINNGVGLDIDLKARYAKNGITRVSIVLNAMDEYDVTCTKWDSKKLEYSVISKHEGIGCERIRDLFEEETGLYTSFRPRRAA